MSADTLPTLLAIMVVGTATSLLLRKTAMLLSFPLKQQKVVHDFYNRHSSYYSKLSPKLKKRFAFRAHHLVKNIKFIGRQGFEVTDTVRYTVVMAIVQITFGFTYFTLPRYKTIFIYPKSYKNPFTGNMHDGEVNPRGLIILSWEKLLKGFEIPGDRINLGLHEIAHALMHSIKSGSMHEKVMERGLNAVLETASKEMQQIKTDENHFLRSYAGVSEDEYFAVAVEHFFESPNEFSEAMPSLYHRMVNLLKQDPATGKYIIA